MISKWDMIGRIPKDNAPTILVQFGDSSNSVDLSIQEHDIKADHKLSLIEAKHLYHLLGKVLKEHYHSNEGKQLLEDDTSYQQWLFYMGLKE